MSLKQGSLARVLIVIDDVHLEPALRPHQRREKTDRAGAGDHQRVRLPGARAAADALGVIPRLRHHARRLGQHAGNAERRVDLDEKFRLDAKKLGAEAVALLDAALGVAAVAAHVPFAGGASGARHRIRPAYDADDDIASRHAAAGRRLLDPAEQFVADHQPRLARGRPAVMSGYDVAVRAADAKRQRPYQYGAVRFRRLGDVVDARRIGNPWSDRQSPHQFLSV